MIINCVLCGKAIEIPGVLEDGQHILCPYCGKKFSYSRSVQDGMCRSFVRTARAINGSVPERPVNHKLMLIGGVVFVVAILICLAVALIFHGGSTGGLELDRQRVDAETCAIGDASVESVLTSGEAGKAYFYAQGNLIVQQVIPKCGVLIGSNLHNSSVALILTERNYIDGVELRPGLYTCIGTARYPNKDGFIKTVLAFEEVDPKVSQQRLAALAKQKAEEELMRQKMAEEARLEREAAAKAAREATEAARIEAARIKAETDAKLEKMRQDEESEKERLRIEAEKQAADAKAKADAAAAEEAKRRYPVEQKMRAEYAATKLSAIQFDLKKYFVLEKALLSPLKSSSVTEDAWRQMKKTAKEKNWLGVLSVAAGDKLKDYPDVKEIDSLVKSIRERSYHAEFNWNECELSGINAIRFDESSRCGYRHIDVVSESSSCIIEFSPANTERVLVYATQYRGEGVFRCNTVSEQINDICRNYMGKCERLSESVRLGRIDQGASASEKHQAFETMKKDVLSCMSRDGFKARRDSVQYDQDETSSSEEFGGNNSSSEMRKSVKKKREIDPRLKTFRGPTSTF